MIKTHTNIASKRILKIFLLVLLAAGLIWGIHLGWHTVHLVRIAMNVRSDRTMIQPETAGRLILDASNDMAAIHQDLTPLFPVFSAMQGLPGIGSYLGQVKPLVTYADGLVQAGKEVYLGLEPLLTDLKSAGQPSFLQSAIPVLQTGQEHFKQASLYLEQAGEVRGQVRPELLPRSIQPYFLKVDERFTLLVAGIDFLQIAPRILGAEKPQSYLVLAQNRDEIRATGGFISGIGIVSVQNGKIVQFDLGDSYQIDDFTKPYPKPPEPLKRFMLADYWVTRDSNWFPDFPSAARQAQALYTLSTGFETQGVIAFNQLAVRSILQVIGPIQVTGTVEPVTANNVETYMQQAWAPAPEQGMSQEWWQHRKDFMKSLGEVIIDRILQTRDKTKVLELANNLMELLDSGQLLVFFNDPAAERALEIGGWGGGIQPGDGDFFSLIDSNVGFNKVDSVIQRSVEYKVDLSDVLHPSADVILSYRHLGSQSAVDCKQEISYGAGTYQDMQQRCYLDYWRVYLPAGTLLKTADARSVPGEQLLNPIGWSGQVEELSGEAGTRVFAGLLMLPAGQSNQIHLTVALPQEVVHQVDLTRLDYGLRIHVQPGLEYLPFTLEVKVPDTYTFVSLGEGWQHTGYNTVVWQANLEQDTDLSLSMQLTTGPEH